MSKIHKKSVYNQDINRIDKYIFFMILLVIGIMPLLVRGKIIEVISPLMGGPVISSGMMIDFFTYYKWVFLIGLSLIVLSLFIYKMERYKYQIYESYINIPCAILLALALLTTLFSEYKYIALVGMYNRHEGLITIICYIILFFIITHIKITEKHLELVTYALGLITIINSAMGLVNFYGYQIVKNPIFMNIIVPKNAQQSISGYIMATLNNPNYVAGFGGVLTTYFLSVVIFSKTRTLKLSGSIFALAAFAMTLVGLSMGGFLALILVVPIIIVLGLLIKGWRSLIPVVIFCLAFTGIFMVLNSYNPKVKDETTNGVIKLFQIVGSKTVSTPMAVAASVPTNVPTISKDHFKLPTPSVSFGAGRGYIWRKTIDLIKIKPLVGYGFDTFVYNFPQNDIEKGENMGSYEMIVDKPHNMFLGMAYSAGVPFLLTFITLIVIFLYYSVKTIKLRNQSVEINELVGWAVTISLFIITFLIQGIFNDSIVSTTPIFFVLLGLGVNLQRHLLISKA